MPFYTFSMVWSIEIGTITHQIAQQSLISLGIDPKAKDYEIFTNNGDLTLSILFADMCNANRKAINKELNSRLKI